ncbi:MAG: spore germination protein [Clostridiales bacterium]|nr:spore germination protein [Candidatus Coliplasma equi]
MNNSPETIINNLSSTFENVSGFTVRKLKTDYIDCSIVFIKDLTDAKFISENAVAKLEKAASSDILSSVSATSVEELQNGCAAADLLCRGNVLIINSDAKIYAFPAPKTEGRGVTEPTSDVTIRGPKAGFTENAEKNLSMLASYIRTPDSKAKAS